jgi:hypothetical protein
MSADNIILYNSRGAFSEDSFDWKETSVIELIDDIRRIFETCFDSYATAIIIQELPIDYKTVRSIRNLISIVRISEETIALIHTGVYELEQFIQNLNTYFLPRAKEIMQVSSLQPQRATRNKELYVLRRLALFALPMNIEKLRQLTGELKTALSMI